MNNQPYFGHEHLDQVERTRAGGAMTVLRESLRSLEGKSADEALAALASFLRSRMEAEKLRDELLRKSVADGTGLGELIAAIELFVDEPSSDRPARLQGVVGGLVRLVAPSVSSQAINDPSRHVAGDVHVPSVSDAYWSAEVKGRALAQHEAEAFVDACEAASIGSAWIVVAFDRHAPLDRASLEQSGRDKDVSVTVIESIGELVNAIVGHPSFRPDRLSEAPSVVSAQLADIGVDPKSLAVWRDLFGDAPE